MKYWVSIVDGEGHRYEEVEGEEVVVGGFERYGFFLHQPVGRVGGEFWMTSEALTGMAIGGWSTTEDGAKWGLEERLREVGVAMFEEKQEGALVGGMCSPFCEESGGEPNKD